MAETPREPDRFEAKAKELYRYCKREIGTDNPASYDCPHPSMDDVAAALRAAEADALERAARGCESMVIGGRAWTEEQAIAAKALFAAAEGILALASPAAAPAAETHSNSIFDVTMAEVRATHGEPVAPVPSLLPRIVAALEDVANADMMTWRRTTTEEFSALAAELRQYIVRTSQGGAGEGT